VCSQHDASAQARAASMVVKCRQQPIPGLTRALVPPPRPRASRVEFLAGLTGPGRPARCGWRCRVAGSARIAFPCSLGPLRGTDGEGKRVGRPGGRNLTPSPFAEPATEEADGVGGCSFGTWRVARRARVRAPGVGWGVCAAGGGVDPGKSGSRDQRDTFQSWNCAVSRPARRPYKDLRSGF
jgi:hypothetical protein